MNYFIDPIMSELYAYDDEQVATGIVKPGLSLCPPRPSVQHIWRDGAWILPQPTNADILAQIAAIEEMTGVPRVVREMMLTYAEDLAQRTADQMTAAGTPTTAQDLLSQNIGYEKTKAVDDQIRALRSQLK